MTVMLTTPVFRVLFDVGFLDVISKKGISNVTVDNLVEEITPTARGKLYWQVKGLIMERLHMIDAATVPDAVKKELLQHIRDYLDQTQQPLIILNYMHN